FAQPEPCLNASFIFTEAVMVENAMNPEATHLAQWRVGKNRGVLNWNVLLIIEPISHPSAQCFPRKPALVHSNVERMFVVVSSRVDRSKVFQKSFAVPEFGSHMTISKPSRAISIPDCFT